MLSFKFYSTADFFVLFLWRMEHLDRTLKVEDRNLFDCQAIRNRGVDLIISRSVDIGSK